MGRLFSYLTTVVFMAVVVAVPLIAVFGMPEVNPVFRELGDKLKDRAFDHIQTLVSPASSDPTVDKNSPLYGLASNQNAAPVDNAVRWGDSSSNAAETKPAYYQQEKSLNGRDSSARVDSRLVSLTNATVPSDQLKTPHRGSGAEQKIPGDVYQPTPMKNLDPIALNPTGMEAYRNSNELHSHDRSSMTFQQAIEILNQFGVSQYRLEAGSRPDQFFFACFYNPPANPTVTMRFEAEANEPIRAVEMVLDQIRSSGTSNGSPMQTPTLNKKPLTDPVNWAR